MSELPLLAHNCRSLREYLIQENGSNVPIATGDSQGISTSKTVHFQKICFNFVPIFSEIMCLPHPVKFSIQFLPLILGDTGALYALNTGTCLNKSLPAHWQFRCFNFQLRLQRFALLILFPGSLHHLHFIILVPEIGVGKLTFLY